MIWYIAEQGNMPKGFQHMLGFGSMFQMHIISKFDLFVPQVFFEIYEDVFRQKVFIKEILDSGLPYGGVHVKMFINDQA